MRNFGKIPLLLVFLAALAIPGTVAGAVNIIHHFEVGSCANPNGNSGLVYDGTRLYGVAAGEDDKNGQGAVFAIKPDGNGFETLHAFSGGDGTGPRSSLVLSGNTLYGTTIAGGDYDDGTVFRINTDGGGFQTLYDFDGTVAGGQSGRAPLGTLLLNGSMLYGTTAETDASGGSIYKIKTDGSDFERLRLLDGLPDGEVPIAGLAIKDSTLYGSTITGGANYGGTLFSLGTDGGGFGVLHNFAGGNGDGNRPRSRCLIDEGFIYGTTDRGGAAGNGVIYRMNLDGSGFTTLHEFDANVDGKDPEGSLLLVGDRLYGITEDGTSEDDGIIYSIKTDGTDFTILDNFGFEAGAEGHLILVGDMLVGMTSSGGDHGAGTIFTVAIPEPATLGLLAFGGLIVVYRRR